eukprot:CAMPEP_0172422448 /NCGR_PEP_ID=MMETSP1064-20121228/8593_1 /TAXON_ID=202472 /ORGANISM="Aulacoseira subarctica , Strain CCAP 1002/5" /LENGTH=235 /DNA_ID=CAMNT_0013163303 /DNA_START=190 /DNA_END=897 /DNA_ORIENTATION=-
MHDRRAIKNLPIFATVAEYGVLPDGDISHARRTSLQKLSFFPLIALSPFYVRLSSAKADTDTLVSQEGQPRTLEQSLYLILRVREATEQETRLIRTGKFKDVQRANVKLAIRYILNNYRLSDNFVQAASFLQGNRRYEAADVGQSATQALYTILEYFDASDVQNLKVGSFDNMAGKEELVLKGLDAAKSNIDNFLSYFPTSTVENVQKIIVQENELNEKEFDPNLGVILNPNPKS